MEITNRETLGAALRQLRTDKGISIRKLAELCEMSKTTIVSAESGQFSPTYDVIQKILSQLDGKLEITQGHS